MLLVLIRVYGVQTWEFNLRGKKSYTTNIEEENGNGIIAIMGASINDMEPMETCRPGQ